jgi:hypothetical protein
MIGKILLTNSIATADLKISAMLSKHALFVNCDAVLAMVSLQEKIAKRVELVSTSRKCLPESLHVSVWMEKVMKLEAYKN